jgi:hypothetical protein
MQVSKNINKHKEVSSLVVVALRIEKQGPYLFETWKFCKYCAPVSSWVI